MSARPVPSNDTPERFRTRLAERLSRRMERIGHPRIQMALMVSATGSAGFFIDWLLLKAGLNRMSLRYALAVGLAYVVFLLLIRLWLVFHERRKARSEEGSSSSSWDVGLPTGSGGSSGGPSGAPSTFAGGGGGSGGGGVSASFADEGAVPFRAIAVPDETFSKGSGASLDVGGDEAVAIVVVVIAVAGAFLAAGYLVVQAPVILGEVLLDGTLSAGLYKRLKKVEHHDWLETAVRKTILPFAAVALLAGLAGHFVQKAAPEARSIGGLFHHVVH